MGDLLLISRGRPGRVLTDISGDFVVGLERLVNAIPLGVVEVDEQLAVVFLGCR